MGNGRKTGISRLAQKIEYFGALRFVLLLVFAYSAIPFSLHSFLYVRVTFVFRVFKSYGALYPLCLMHSMYPI